MPRSCRHTWMVAMALWFAPSLALAQVCSSPTAATTYAERIAAVACNENTLWYSPFIDSNGRLASTTVAEAEGMRLNDGATPAWRRVVEYWKGSGVLGQMAGFPGASDCSYAIDAQYQSAACRAFLIDNPWSAVFVSYVMNRAGVPGFRASPSHVDYVRDAYLHPDRSPYLLVDPDTEKPQVGDLLCFARSRSAFGHPGLKAFLDGGNGSLAMHCDIAVALGKGDTKLYLVGGNVLQGVTMRVLNLNRNGQLWGLPRRSGIDVDCRADNDTACSFNRQDWVALLKLKPSLPMTVAMLPLPSAPAECCDACPLPMPPNLQRCAKPAAAPNP